MKDRFITNRRMQNLGLSGKPLGAPEDVVRWLGAVQSQDYGPAKWAIAQRTAGMRDPDLDQTFSEGTILRTHLLRPTWHFVLPEDILWMLELTAPRVHSLNAYYYRQLGLDQAVLKKSNNLIRRALRGGDHLTRKEIEAMLNRAGITTESFRLGYILMNAELSATLCSGAMKGKQHTYALLEDRAPAAKSMTGDEALAGMTLRYFRSHGPATVKDFQWWSSLRLVDIKKGIEMVASHLELEVIDGLSFWSAKRARALGAKSPSVHLLQGYDEYIVGYSESKRFLLPSGSKMAFQVRPQYTGVIVLDDQAAGQWKRTLKKDAVIIDAALHAPFNKIQSRALQIAADKHGEFLGLPATVVTAN